MELTGVRLVLNELDIEGLLSPGAAGDEYDLEAVRIAEALKGLPALEVTEDRVADIIEDVWSAIFGPFFPEDLLARQHAFHLAARRILRPRRTAIN
ncbi:MAG TPA: hypothetical protein VMV31_02560 [Terriglobales bacterium]|nr:hypothetical protein [Terriglobales bacterium]